jgi:hypothetical protein
VPCGRQCGESSFIEQNSALHMSIWWRQLNIRRAFFRRMSSRMRLSNNWIVRLPCDSLGCVQSICLNHWWYGWSIDILTYWYAGWPCDWLIHWLTY